MRILSGRLTLSFTLTLAGAATLHAQTTASPAPQETSGTESRLAQSTPVSVSDVRIVRLSEIKGEAQLDRNTGRGFEPAFANLPIVQHAKLRTTEGVAEVEFEDNSSLRLTPNTIVDFSQLGRSSAGATLSTIHVLQGTVYISLSSTKSKTSPNQFTVTFGDTNQALVLEPSTHLELSLGTPTVRLAVFEGSVEVPHGASTVIVSKKKQLLFDPANPTASTLITKIEKSPFDEWDKNQADYHQRYANAAFGLGSSFGTSDLNYYGSFADLPGCGNVWRPYFASAAWDPFANGVMAWYPNAGYSWVSPYPWGWQPFHSGSWQQCGSSGWGWRPGGQWTGLQNLSRRPTSTLTPTHPRPPAPLPGRPTIIAVSTQHLPVSRLAAPDTFVFNKDSAGLGVPRQTFGKLGGLSNDVARHGVMATSVDSAPGLVRSGGGAVAIAGTPHPATNGIGSRPASAYSGASSVVVSPRPTSSSPSFSPAPNSSGAWSGGNPHSSMSAPPATHASAPMSAPSAPPSSSAPSRK